MRTGALNLLVATAVAEEGLDLPACCLVLRFDLPVRYLACWRLCLALGKQPWVHHRDLMCLRDAPKVRPARTCAVHERLACMPLCADLGVIQQTPTSREACEQTCVQATLFRLDMSNFGRA